MSDYLIKEYVERMTVDDINRFARTQGITLTENELEVIYDCIKKHWRTFYYGNPKDILEDLKQKLSIDTYNKLEALYIQAKDKLI